MAAALEATTCPYPDEESAAKNRREVSPWYLPLDERRRFRLMPDPQHEDAALADASYYREHRRVDIILRAPRAADFHGSPRREF